MCHQYTDDASGKYHDLDARMKETKLTNDRMVAVLTRGTNLDAAAVMKKLLPPSDVWLTPEELVKYAAADQII
jgi:ATP-dependent protease ClpP protease subunit